MVVKSAYKIISLTYNLSEEINLNDQFNSFSYHVDIEDLNMNLNTLQVALKSQINAAIRGSEMTVAETREVLNAELENLLHRAEILEVIPFPTEVVGVSHQEMVEYIDRYQAMMEHWLSKTSDIFLLVETLEKLRFDEVKSEISLVTKLTDLAGTIDYETRGQWGEITAAFHGDKVGKWARSIRNVKTDVAYAAELAKQQAAQPTTGMATAR